MNTFLAFRSLEYFMFSKHKNGHGIHSPFVYSLIKNVFENKTGSNIVSIVESSRKKLRSDNRLISVNDLGAGSLKIWGRQRKVSEIARHASTRPAYGSLLARLAVLVDSRLIIELGTSLGIGSMYLALGAKNSRVISVEGCTNTAMLAEEIFRENNIGNIELVKAGFDEVLENILLENDRPGLVFINGDHRSEALLRYINIIEPFVTEETIVVIDDIHYSRDMENGWKRIKELASVGISIDLLQLGLLFFRKGTRKQDYVIRY